MEMAGEVIIPYGREIVFTTIRDRQAEITQYMPNIEDFEVCSREEPEDDIVAFVNIWYATNADIPSVAKPFVHSNMLRWTDYARWDQAHWTTEWRMETAFLTDRIHCAGINYYEDLGNDRTKLVITGDLSIRPPMIARAAKGPLEKWVVGLIEPNLTSTGEAVVEFLDAQS